MYSTRLPKLFRMSCEDHEEYPLKLVGRGRYGVPFLNACQQHLEERQERRILFVPESEISLPYLDVLPTGVVDSSVLNSEKALSDFLGDEFEFDRNNPDLVKTAKKDQSCRFLFLKTAGSAMPTELTEKALKRILSYYQVMPALLDFVYMYGSEKYGKDREIRFSRFRTERSLDNPYPDLDLGALNRSGRRYQLCYNLKTVGLKNFDEGKVVSKVWKIRQAYVYHQFDVVKATQLWLVGDPLSSVQGWIREHLLPNKNHQTRFETFGKSFWTSLELHLTYVKFAMQEWRWHVESLEEIIENLTDRLMISDPGMMKEWRSGAIVMMQEQEDTVRETLMAVQSNADIITRLLSFYGDLVNDHDFPASQRAESARLVKKFSAQLEEHLHDNGSQISRTQGILTLISDRKQILIQHLQAQAAERTESLTRRQEDLAKNASLEAIAVRIITVITLFYLPATFVGTFFSTDVVHYEADNSDSSGGASDTPQEQKSALALERFLQVSLPLMAITFGLAISWYYYERRRLWNKPSWADSEKQ